jgi:hypothetical protein
MLDRLIEGIASKLVGIHVSDLTTAERQIAQLLVDADFLTYTADQILVKRPAQVS